jgi:hypothetical protein
MNKLSKRFNLHLIILGLSLVIISSCKKDETKNDPLITWENPADIVFGTLLSTTQLNATANVPGSFFYTPGIGANVNSK